MLSATLKSGLGDYDIGGKIRTLRLKKKMGLVELGKHTGLSPALLSKDRAGAAVSDATDAAAHRARLRRRSRVLLRGRTREAAGRRRPPARARPADGAAAGARQRIPFRVARLPGRRASVQRVLRGIPAGGTRQATSTRPRRRGVHLCAAGKAKRADRERRTRPRSRRFDLLRFEYSAQL